MKYVTFAKAAPLSSTVELGLGPDSPLSVKYELENAAIATKTTRKLREIGTAIIVGFEVLPFIYLIWYIGWDLYRV